MDKLGLVLVLLFANIYANTTDSTTEVFYELSKENTIGLNCKHEIKTQIYFFKEKTYKNSLFNDSEIRKKIDQVCKDSNAIVQVKIKDILSSGDPDIVFKDSTKKVSQEKFFNQLGATIHYYRSVMFGNDSSIYYPIENPLFTKVKLMRNLPKKYRTNSKPKSEVTFKDIRLNDIDKNHPLFNSVKYVNTYRIDGQKECIDGKVWVSAKVSKDSCEWKSLN